METASNTTADKPTGRRSFLSRVMYVLGAVAGSMYMLLDGRVRSSIIKPESFETGVCFSPFFTGGFDHVIPCSGPTKNGIGLNSSIFACSPFF